MENDFLASRSTTAEEVSVDDRRCLCSIFIKAGGEGGTQQQQQPRDRVGEIPDSEAVLLLRGSVSYLRGSY